MKWLVVLVLLAGAAYGLAQSVPTRNDLQAYLVVRSLPPAEPADRSAALAMIRNHPLDALVTRTSVEDVVAWTQRADYGLFALFTTELPNDPEQARIRYIGAAHRFFLLPGKSSVVRQGG